MAGAGEGGVEQFPGDHRCVLRGQGEEDLAELRALALVDGDGEVEVQVVEYAAALELFRGASLLGLVLVMMSGGQGRVLGVPVEHGTAIGGLEETDA
jgi:hypothetical protein